MRKHTPHLAPRHRPVRGALVALVVGGLLVPGALLAQSGGGEVSRTEDGRVLHRRPPEKRLPAGEPELETPIFTYDPARASGLPSDMQRDGRSFAKPSESLDPGDNEPVFTAEGPRPAERPEPAPAATPPGPPGPRSDPGGPVEARTRPELPPDPASPSAEVRAGPMDGAAPAAPSGGAEDPGALPPSPHPMDTPSDPNAPMGADGDPHGSDGGEGLRDPIVGDDFDPFGAAPDGAGSQPPPGPGEVASDPRTGLGDEALPDRRTEREGRLDYTEVFDPSVVPFKRNRALDEVGPDFGLRVGERRFEKVEPIGNRLERGHEVFWGSLLLDGPAGARIPIPSVSPEGRILSYEASPPQKVGFERDQAGNFYAIPERGGRMRLVFVTDAPAHWFSRTLPRDVRFADLPRELRPKVPRKVAAEAQEVAAALGFSTTLGFVPLLERMVAYFRSFEAGEPPPSTGHVYRDIALGRRGICRHRSHAFVVTAQALGYAARYVFNEAHVFVEVYIPGERPGWLRIDLGGGADELRVHNAKGKGLHAPAGADPFEQPEGFGDLAGAARATGLPEAVERAPEAAREPRGRQEGMIPAGLVPRASPHAGLAPTRTTLRVAENLVFRGDGLRVSGEVTASAGGVVDGGVVQVLVVRAEDDVALALLGTAPVVAGRFEGDVRVPEELPIGDYELIVEFLGNGVHGPSVGR